jgi:hypothetical protein
VGTLGGSNQPVIVVIVDYFVQNPQGHVTSKLRLLTRANEEAVRRLAQKVVQSIAALSPLDHMRMNGMGLLAKPAAVVETITEEYNDKPG